MNNVFEPILEKVSISAPNLFKAIQDIYSSIKDSEPIDYELSDFIFPVGILIITSISFLIHHRYNSSKEKIVDNQSLEDPKYIDNS